MKVAKAWLIVKATGDVRVRTRRPLALGLDEIAVPLTINIPDGWGSISSQTITINMPDPPTVDNGEALVPDHRPTDTVEAMLK